MGFIVWFFVLQCSALIFNIALVVSSGLWDFLPRGLEMFYMLLPTTPPFAFFLDVVFKLRVMVFD